MRLLKRHDISAKLNMTEQLSTPDDVSSLLERSLRYKVVSVRHLQEMQDYMDRLRENGLFSTNTVFRSYVDDKSFRLPADFQDARYLVAVAVYNPLAKVNLPYEGHVYSVMIPPNYRIADYTADELRAAIVRKAIGRDGNRFESAGRNAYRKHLAARSGLAKYGRNNICHVKGWGSMISLYAFYTDYEFSHDDWTDVQMMDSCKRCKLCFNQCPTGAISTERFVINVDRCLPLYNEVEGEIPEWVPKNAHNALVGCMRCQLKCPANRDAIARAVQLDDLSEKETVAVINGVADDDAKIALCDKLRVCTAESFSDNLPVFSRNLRAFIAAQTHRT